MYIPKIAIIGHGDHIRTINSYLAPFYNVMNFTEHDIDHIRIFVPALIMIDEKIGFNCAKTIRKNMFLNNIPIIYITLSNFKLISKIEEDRFIQNIKNNGVDDYISKPFSNCLRKITKVLNRRIELQWELLPSTEKTALKNTLQIFDKITDLIEVNAPLQFDNIKTACTPLIESVYKDNYKVILNNIKDYDDYTFSHSLKVATLLSLFGYKMKLSKDEQLLISCGGLLHDVGKLCIDKTILNKPGKLTPEEFEIMKSHVNLSVKILKQSGIPEGIIKIAAQHHEKIDGTGYPNKLSKLDDLSKMAAIIDIYSALTDKRSYKPALTQEQTFEIMEKEMIGFFDWFLYKEFKNMILESGSYFCN